MVEQRTKNNINYTKVGDYFHPNLTVPEQEKFEINRFGRARLEYLKQHKRGKYISLKCNFFIIKTYKRSTRTC